MFQNLGHTQENENYTLQEQEEKYAASNVSMRPRMKRQFGLMHSKRGLRHARHKKIGMSSYRDKQEVTWSVF